MIPRFITKQLDLLVKQFPVITIIGPRQSGKTTLAKNYFSGYKYVNLEKPDVRDYAIDDPNGFLNDNKAPVIFDEIQRVPKLISYIQDIVDTQESTGQYILTGSHQPALKESVTQSLAGRTAILQLLPLSIAELSSAGYDFQRNDYIYRGFLPKLYKLKGKPNLEYSNYYHTYVERDVTSLINLRYKREFEIFIRLLAGRIGQLINLSSMANDVGVSVKTLSEWLNVLEASFIIFRLPCFFENFGKRLVKTPKLYFTEVGLASWLLGITDVKQLSSHPLIGNLFENMVVLEALKQRFNSGKENDLYFFRDQRGFEIDLLLTDGNKIIPYEIKSAQTYTPDFAKNLKTFAQRSENIESGYVVYTGDLERSGQPALINFKNLANSLDI
ncbi:MAG: ATP-binding protein [Candidatus Riflebacteria bacterium]|nr:ATP-binding protein [Candidatus Riflebacteria bacterium]